MSRERYFPPIERNGLVARLAAGMRARFGIWPKDFLVLVQREYRGQIPDHVLRLSEQLARLRPWERCEHGSDLTADFPYCPRCVA